MEILFGGVAFRVNSSLFAPLGAQLKLPLDSLLCSVLQNKGAVIPHTHLALSDPLS